MERVQLWLQGVLWKLRGKLMLALRGVKTIDRTPVRFGRWYNYELRYPDEPEVFGWMAGTTFYVGKGTKDRLLEHEKETRRLLKTNPMKMKHKHKVILSIWDAGYDVVQVVVHRTDDEQEAYEVEAELIRAYGLERLTNATYGHSRRKRGVCYV
jgi:hypothetical protein